MSAAEGDARCATTRTRVGDSSISHQSPPQRLLRQAVQEDVAPTPLCRGGHRGVGAKRPSPAEEDELRPQMEPRIERLLRGELPAGSGDEPVSPPCAGSWRKSSHPGGGTSTIRAPGTCRTCLGPIRACTVLPTPETGRPLASATSRRMSRRRIQIAIPLLLAVFAGAATLTPSTGAQDVDKLRQRADSKRASERELSGDVARLGTLLRRLQADIAVVERRRSEVQAELAEDQAKLGALRSDLRGQRARVQRLKTHLRESQADPRRPARRALQGAGPRPAERRPQRARLRRPARPGDVPPARSRSRTAG